jgi:hypothetical protein
MADFFRNYAVLIGFFLGVAGMYLKIAIDRKVESTQTKRKLSKLIDIINNSPAPLWLKTYFEPSLEINHENFSINTENMAKFKIRMIVIESFIDEISKEIYKNLAISEIIKFNHIKWWTNQITKNIKKLEDEFNNIDSSKFNLLKSDDLALAKTQDDLAKLQEKLNDGKKEKLKFENIIISTNIGFKIISISYDNLKEVCSNQQLVDLSYRSTN